MEHVLKESSVGIRVPATANLMIDSLDRNPLLFTNPWSFQIQRPQAILNGFFNRIGTTELVLEWRVENIAAAWKNTLITFVDAGGNHEVTVPDGFYTVAELLDTIVAELNAIVGAGTYVVTAIPGVGAQIARQDNANFQIVQSYYDPPDNTDPSFLPVILGLIPGAPAAAEAVVEIRLANIRPIRYLDFVCSQLTYNQDLKDSATQPKAGDVLARWYMAYDNPTGVDAYGFPILMGYEAFNLRRLFNPPKQIKWDKIQPIGNLAFDVYFQGFVVGTYKLLASVYPQDPSQWLMTLQASEN